MLGNAASLARHNIGVADRVEQRGLAVVDVAHDGNDGCARLPRLRRIGLADEAFLDVFLRHALHRMAELGCDQLGSIGVDHVVDLQHLPLFHQELDDVDGALRHAVSEFLNRDSFGQLDLALNF